MQLHLYYTIRTLATSTKYYKVIILWREACAVFQQLDSLSKDVSRMRGCKKVQPKQLHLIVCLLKDLKNRLWQ